MLRLSNVMETAIAPALSILPRYMDSTQARVLLLAIGLQESAFTARCQFNGGPARGYWMFELGTQTSRGGVWGVFLHHDTHEQLRLLCRERDVNFDPAQIWARLECDDILAAGVARLMLITDPNPLPAIGDADTAWGYYLRVWRPGKPRPKDWPPLYAQAMEEVCPA